MQGSNGKTQGRKDARGSRPERRLIVAGVSRGKVRGSRLYASYQRWARKSAIRNPQSAILIAALCLCGLALNSVAQDKWHTLQNAVAANANGGTLIGTTFTQGDDKVMHAAAVVITATGTLSATLNFETTVMPDDSQWTAVIAVDQSDYTHYGTTTAAAGKYFVLCPGAQQLRVRISSWVSGAITIKACVVPGTVSKAGSGGAAAETDPVVKAISGIVKSDTSTIAAAVAGTDYVAPNTAITGATKTKVTYDAKGLVTAGANATTADVADSADKRYVTDAQRTVIGNTSGANTGDQDISGLVPKTTTVNGHALSGNVSVTPTDLSLVLGTNVQAWDGDLDAIAALSGTGYAKRTAPNTWSLDTSVFATDSLAMHLAGAEAVTGAKTFGAGSSGAPLLKIGTLGEGFFEEAGVGLAILSGSGDYIRFYNSSLSCQWDMKGGSFRQCSGTGGTAIITSSVASSTVPVFVFTGDTATGLGRGASGQPSLIANGVESARFSSAGMSTKHLIGTSTAPTIANGAGAGTSPGTPAIVGTDMAGQITVITGTLPSVSAVAVTVTFNTAYGTAPYVVIWPANAAAATLGFLPYVGSTTTTFTVNAGTIALGAATTYLYNYVVIQ